MAVAVKIVYTIEDNKGKRSNMTVKVPSTLTLVDYVEFAEEMGDLVDAITVGQIVNVGIAFTVDFSGFGWTAAPGSTADVEEKGLFSYLTAGGWRTALELPCLSESKVVDGSDVIDAADADVIAFQAAMVSGITLPIATTLVAPTDAREDDIASAFPALERFHASGRRR